MARGTADRIRKWKESAVACFEDTALVFGGFGDEPVGLERFINL